MPKISDNLELLVLGSLIGGSTDIKLVRKEELSRTGQFIYDGLSKLLKKQRAPFRAGAVLAAAADLAGGDPDILRPYIAKAIDAGGGQEVSAILEAIHEKQVLLDVVNMASKQMAGSGLNRQEFIEKLGRQKTAGMTSVASFFQGNERHRMPEGVPLTDLPRLNAATHGFYGVWALSGDSGVGKSTLTLELAVQVARCRPVLFYDYENGQPVLLSHLSQAFNYNNKHIRKATEHIYFRDGIHSLDADLSSLGRPCLIVVDSLQKIAVRGSEDKRQGIEKWVHKLEAMKLLGHCVLMVSEKNRAYYGRTGQAGYKESGEIEYTVDVGLELMEVKGSSGVVEMSINKNRNWPNKGYISTISRKNNWWFVESPSNRRSYASKSKESCQGKKR